MSFLLVCSKCFLYLFYSLLLVASSSLIYIGSKTLSLTSQYPNVAKNAQIISSAICFLAAGLLLLVITVIGVAACYKRSLLLLVVFYSLVVVVLFCEIGAVLLSVFHWPGLEDKVKEVLLLELNAYDKDSDARFKVDYAQSTLQCCGIDSFNDWNETVYFKEHQDYPPSCCSSNVSIMQQNGKLSISNTTTPMPSCTPYINGCKSMLSELFHAKMTLIIAIGVIFVLFQVLGLHASCILTCHSQPPIVPSFEDVGYTRI